METNTFGQLWSCPILLEDELILDLFGAFGQERIDTLMFLTKASEDEIRGVGGGLDPGTVRAP